MAEHILFLTGKLAYASLCRELEAMAKRAFTYHVHELGLKVAALMTADMIQRRLHDTFGATRIVVPGLCSGNVAALAERFGVPVERGPKDLKDLPEYFGAQGRKPDLSQHTVKIFAEIVDAPQTNVEAIVARARAYCADGADVIDLGCLPETPFPHLEEAIQALHAENLRVSVDSLESADLLRGGKAGADYLLSLKESTLWIAAEVASAPVLIPEHAGDVDSLIRACESRRPGRDYYADSILDPIHFGFTESVVRYHELRRRLPTAPIMMGTGNVTELTDADTTGVTALLMGVISELGVQAILTTEVSPHAKSAVREADIGRRIMHAAKQDGRLPRGYHNGLMALRERKPFPYTTEDIAATARAIKDPSFRIQLSADGIHVYNRDGMKIATDPFAFFSHLGVEQDGGHAFYLGVELARAQIAWQLGKRYLQDNELGWGVAVPEPSAKRDDGYREAGATLKARHGS
ncbi:MAG: DUF6513 domain-containing protein [Gammaproteobacteria bacterium]